MSGNEYRRQELPRAKNNDGGVLARRQTSLQGFLVRHKVIVSLVIVTAMILAWTDRYLGLRPPQSPALSFEDRERTPSADLKWTKPEGFKYGGIYNNENDSLTDQSWDDFGYEIGAIALTDHHATSLGLPKAQRFPWDEKKGLYFLNGFRGVHCLKIIRTTLLELRAGKLPKHLTFPLAHSSHCLEVLMQDIMCFADNTPLATSIEDPPGTPGNGQKRECRDWTKLEAFAREHASCWRNIDPNEDEETRIRYEFCAPGSPYNFGKQRRAVS